MATRAKLAAPTPPGGAIHATPTEADDLQAGGAEDLASSTAEACAATDEGLDGMTPAQAIELGRSVFLLGVGLKVLAWLHTHRCAWCSAILPSASPGLVLASDVATSRRGRMAGPVVVVPFADGRTALAFQADDGGLLFKSCSAECDASLVEALHRNALN